MIPCVVIPSSIHAFPSDYFQTKGLYKGRNLIPVSVGNPQGSNPSAGSTNTLDFTALQSKGNIPVVWNPAITLPIVMPRTHALENTSEN